MERRSRRVLVALVVAGLLLGPSAFAAGPAPPEPARTVEVVMHHSRFLPDRMQFAPGERVRFVLRNEDPIDHEFILGDRAVQQRHETGTEPYHDQVPTEVTVSALSTTTTTIRLPLHGPVLIGCHLPGHWAYGMRAEVSIG